VEIGTKVYALSVEMSGTTGSVIGCRMGILDETTNAVDTTTVLPSFNGIFFPNAMVPVGSYVYVYGGKSIGYGVTNVYVARFATTSPGTWTFWDGSTWASSATTAAIVATTGSNGLTVSYVNGKYVMIYTAWNFGCGSDDGIYGMSSTSPTGGFSSAIKIYDIPDRSMGYIPFFYTPIVHPEFTANNEFLLTYCINMYSRCIPTCVSGEAIPDNYRPRAVRVPFSLLGL
jgi:hypothetical protein